MISSSMMTFEKGERAFYFMINHIWVLKTYLTIYHRDVNARQNGAYAFVLCCGLRREICPFPCMANLKAGIASTYMISAMLIRLELMGRVWPRSGVNDPRCSDPPGVRGEKP